MCVHVCLIHTMNIYGHTHTAHAQAENMCGWFILLI